MILLETGALASEAQVLLDVEDLTVTFPNPLGRHVAVGHFRLQIREKEIVALVGESGCGKSVVARSILGLLRPPGRVDPTARITFGGVELTGLNEKQRRRIRGSQISMVFQDALTSLNPVYRVGKQLVDAARAHERLSPTAARRRALEALAEARLPAPERVFHQYPHELSGGMRQRVAIALAVLCHPQLIIADEATTALDVTIQAQILELLRDMCSAHGTSVLFISHDLGVVADLSDRVVVMYAGRVVECGQTLAVIENPRHPYTEALVRAVPRIGDIGRFVTLPGEVPRLTEQSRGCCFRSRCSRASELCVIDEPVLQPVAPSEVACWHPIVSAG